MIIRFRAWAASRRLLAEEVAFQLAKSADQEAVIARYGAMLTKEQMLTAGLTSDVARVTGQNIVLRHKADEAEAIAARLRADHTYVTAERCECGGDTELYWRRRAAASEAQAQRDRANAIRLTSDVERLQQIADEAERLHRVIELGRAGIAVVS